MKYGAGTRRTAAAAVVVCIVAITAPRVGRQERTDANAISAIRAIQSAELIYASVNDGYYDILECLVVPSCAPKAPSGRTPFLQPRLATAKEWGGYRIEFHRGPAARVDSTRTSRSSMTRFAVVAIPLRPGPAQPRAFCGDDTGTIYVSSGEQSPRVDDGRCLDTDSPLR